MGPSENLPLSARADNPANPTVVGWERNAAGKLGPKMADLGPLMDPSKLADQAVDLNLKLMRWRILPEINLEKIQTTRCLLLGAGTLGCYVARTLLVSPVLKISLAFMPVDSILPPTTGLGGPEDHACR